MEKARIPEQCDRVVGYLTEALTTLGLQVHLSFNLQSARRELANPDGCPCPYHGTVDCSCQYIVMLVSREGFPPISIVAHGHEDQTHLTFSLPDSARADQATIEAVGGIVSGLVSTSNSSQP